MTTNVDSTPNDGEGDASHNGMELSWDTKTKEDATTATIENVPTGTSLATFLGSDMGTSTKPEGITESSARTFVYWTIGGSRFKSDTTVTGDVTVKARWSDGDLGASTVTFTGACDNTGNDAASTVTLVKGDKLASWDIPSWVKIDTAVYQVRGWATSKSATEPMDLSTVDTSDDVTVPGVRRLRDCLVRSQWRYYFSSDSSSFACVEEHRFHHPDHDRQEG